MARKRAGSSKSAAAPGWVSSVTSGVAASLIVAALSGIGTFAMGWLRVEKSPQGIRVVRGEALGGAPLPPSAPANSIRVSSEGDRVDSQRLAADLEPLLQQRLRPPAAMEGLAVRYRLANLAFAGGASRRVAVRWAVGLPGKVGAACSETGISFYSAPNLAERLADHINTSIAATEQRGEPACR